MRILFVGKNPSQGLKDFDPSSLAGVAQSLGFVRVNSLGDAPDAVLCVDFHKSVLSVIREARSRGIRTVLIANEPEVVIPEHSQVRVLEEFDEVLKVGRPEGPNALKWPQTWLPISENEDRRNRAVLVNADKWSFISGQHYWLRAAASSQLDNIDVFGFGWDRPLFIRFAHRLYELWRTMVSRSLPKSKGITKILAKPRSYKGSASNKYSTMSRYKVALVIENSSEFLSEKLFDAWSAGCMPVYVGPPVEAFGIPSDLVIQVKKPSIREVKNCIEIALAADREVFMNKLNAYLTSGTEAVWKAESALKAILMSAIRSD